MKYSRWCAVCSLAATVALLGACTNSDSNSDSASGPSPSDEISIDDFASVTANLNPENGTVVLPLDKYRNQTPETVARAYHAIDSVTNVCLAKKGLPTVSDTRSWSVPPPASDRTFGQWDVSEAKRFGFTPDPSRGRPLTDTLSLGKEVNDALPGCMEDAKSRLATQLTFDQQQGIDVQIDRSAYEHTLADPAGKQALAKRTKCMSDKGVIVAADTNLPSFQYDSKPPKEQIRVATIEAECSVETGAIHDLFTLEARYQAAYIAQYEAQLVALQKDAQRNADSLDRVIAKATRGEIPEKSEHATGP